MFDLLFELLRYVSTLLFGTFLSAVFLPIEMDRKDIFILGSFSASMLALQGLLYFAKGVQFLTVIYPLIVHLPLLLLFILVFNQRMVHAIFAITTTYLCCQVANWGSIIPATFGGDNITENLTYTIVLIAAFILIYKYVAPSFHNLYRKPMSSFLTFAVVPAFYYMFDYFTTVYSDLLYSDNKLVVEFTPFMLCFCYLFFCTVYFEQYEEKLEVEQYNQLMEMQKKQTSKEMQTIQRSEKTIALLRHDMRHFLSVIVEYIDNNQLEHAKAYIEEIIDLADSTQQKKYCANDTVNMILSYCEGPLHESSIQLHHNLQVSSVPTISDVDLTAILFNSMENAIHAVLELPPERRFIELSIVEKNDKLLFSIKNPYAKTPKFMGDMPTTENDGHGFGTQSIRYTVEKLNGNCQFSLADGMFILRVII